MAGGICKLIPLRLNSQTLSWYLDMIELENAITSKTKILLLNTPHNPTGKVFTHEEYLQIVDIVNRHPHITVVMDEVSHSFNLYLLILSSYLYFILYYLKVYEKLVYDGRVHNRFCTYPNMWDRTLTVSSAGKTFSCTGWKVGWIYGASNLITPIMLANQWIQFSVSTPAQRALVEILEKADQPYEGFNTYYDYICNTYERKRNYLVETLQNVSLTPVIPQGGFFIMANISNIAFPDKYLEQPLPNGSNATRDWGFARWLTIEVGVTPIPPTSFYTPDNRFQGENLGKYKISFFYIIFYLFIYYYNF